MKKKVLVIFGGQSSEHDVSVKSVLNVIDFIDRKIYEPILLGISRQGEWKLVDDEKKINFTNCFDL